MAKYNKKIINQICKLIASDSYTISEICRNVGISDRCYYNWQNEYAEFAEAIKGAEEDRRQFFAVEAKKSLLKKVQGYTVQEQKTVMAIPKKTDNDQDSVPIVKEQTITEKYFQPDTAAIIFTLCNTDPDNWKNKQNSDITSGGEKLQFGTKELTKEEAVKRLKELEQEY